MADKPWLASYPDSVPAEIDPARYASLAALLRDAFARNAGRPAFSNLGTVLTFDDVDRLSAAFAGWLRHEAGLDAGERVAVVLPNLLASPVVIFGVLRAGLTVVNFNPLYTETEIEHQLVDSGARAAVVLENFAAKLERVIARTAVEHVVVATAGDHFPWAKRLVASFVVRRVKRLVPSYRLDAAIGYRRALELGRRHGFTDPEIAPDATAFLQYTGGTTGLAKGAMLTHANMVSNVLQAAAWVDPFYDPELGVTVTPLPLYHIFALTVNLLSFCHLGGHNLLITDPRNIDRLVGELERQPFAFISGVNTLFNALLASPRFAKLDFGSLRITLGGGMAVQRDVAERWRALTGCVIAQGYGLTEASPVVSANPLDLTAFNGSVGLPLPSTDVAIADDDGNWLGLGETGEICVRGPQVMAGYWNRPDETENQFFPGGWLRTGDMGRLDEAGFLYIEDRKKDMIIVSGFKVYPNEVEDTVTGHPGVHEAAAIGIPHEQSGEAVKLFVVKRDPSLTASVLETYCRERLARYKVPTLIEFIDELPKSNVGKVLRRELRDSA